MREWDTEVHMQRKGHVRTQRKGGHLQAGKRGLTESSPAGTLILDFQPPNCEKVNFCPLSHPVCGVQFWQPKLSNAEGQWLHGEISVSTLRDRNTEQMWGILLELQIHTEIWEKHYFYIKTNRCFLGYGTEFTLLFRQSLIEQRNRSTVLSASSQGNRHSSAENWIPSFWKHLRVKQGTVPPTGQRAREAGQCSPQPFKAEKRGEKIWE